MREKNSRQFKKNNERRKKQSMKELNPPVQKNDVIETIVQSQGNSGEGVLKVEDYPLFMPGGLPGELVRARVVRINPSHGFARLEEILEPSDDRVEPPCPYYGHCGGCNMQHQSYEGQLHFKTERVRDCFTRIGRFIDPDVLPAIGMEIPWRYRNKVQMPVGEREGEIRVGFYKGRSHEIIDIKECLIQNVAADQAAEIVRSWLKAWMIPVAKGDDEIIPDSVRHLLIREGRWTGEIMVVLVATSREIQHLEELNRALQEELPGFTGLILNINDELTNRVLGEKNYTIWGKDHIIDTIGDVKYRISPHSFFQVNPQQTKVIYDKVIELAKFTGTERVLDLYCGAGAIALYIAKTAGHITGVEIVPEAIEDANYNKELNDIKNVDFILGKAEEVIGDLMASEIAVDLVIVDPPRKGCDESLLAAIGESTITKMIYVSCDPATLARDAAILNTYGFSPEVIQPVDNFPQTHHVETVVLITRDNK